MNVNTEPYRRRMCRQHEEQREQIARLLERRLAPTRHLDRLVKRTLAQREIAQHAETKRLPRKQRRQLARDLAKAPRA